LQASSGLIFNVLEDYNPENLLLKQAYTEVFNQQIDEHRLMEAFKRIENSKIILKFANAFTPLSFPIKVDSLRQSLSSEDLDARILRLQNESMKKNKNDNVETRFIACRSKNCAIKKYSKRNLYKWVQTNQKSHKK
jgi:ATP dependent helicase, Lhr family